MAQGQDSWNMNVGMFIFVILCGFSALELTGFGFGIPMTFGTALMIAIVGGGVGGGFVCPNPIPAGVIGGLIAGPLGLIAVYYYTLNREEIYHVEIIFVQGIASLPGVGVGKLIQFVMQKQGH